MSRMRIDDKEIINADVFQSLIDHFPDMVHSIDEAGNIVYANQTAEALLGYTREELLSMSIWEIYPDEIMDAVQEGFKSLKQRGDFRVESILKAKDGQRIPVEIRSFGIYDDDGNFIRTFSTLRDMRPIKELQNSLVHAGRLAAIGELASGVAHDINNPLTVVTLSSEMMLTQLRSEAAIDAETLASWCKDIQKASRSIAKLSEHLRNFSRGIVEEYTPVDLYDVIEDSIFITSSKINGARVDLQNTVTKDRHYTLGSRNQLEQVFVNMIANACDAMADGERGRLSICMSSTVFNDVDYWACEIADTGEGIPPDVVEHIFQSFFTTKPKGKGTGLGLSISRGIIKEHLGEIQVASTPGIGTLFSILLPRAERPLKVPDSD
ncbi:MAG: ATP-binding protein [Verrucomicrobia bacterium]|nr:ATP-binding protein [Verrucomicrobiota bacterium]MDA1088144.1 ATP-binding protein [Verrucomicrobiota bacterium]